LADRWQLLTDDAGERQRFASLAAVMALPSTPAAPRNRLRHVVRIESGGRVYFLKTFTSTQWRNRFAFATTAPRAHDDAERELRVTQALKAAGHHVPRPIAYGRRGASSFYLCAALPGQPLRELLRAGVDAQVLRGIATYCGQALAAGFRLPDLSAEHVFVDDDGDLYLLDLHNGRVAPPGPAAPRMLQRVLRRFRRSVQDLGLPRSAALRFAVRLLRQAGCRDVRALLGGEPPWATAARYDAPGKSGAYADRNPARTARELRLLQRVWPGNPGEAVLDLPCGAGRLLPFLREHGHAALQADGSLAMLREARARGTPPAPGVLADALAMPFADRAVEGVVMFRFLHHLPPDAARLAIAEACRIAGRFVVVSFFHPCSVHHARRLLRQLVGGRHTRFAQTLAALRSSFGKHGFELASHAADLAFVRDLWVAAFVRRLAPADTNP
jgi:SAM-dependent methyltransferase